MGKTFRRRKTYFDDEQSGNINPKGRQKFRKQQAQESRKNRMKKLEVIENHERPEQRQ